MSKKARSKKAKNILFHTVEQCAAAWRSVIPEYAEGQAALDNAKALFQAGVQQVMTCARQTRQSGLTIGKSRRTCKIAAAIYDGLKSHGYSDLTATYHLSRIRTFVATGKWPVNGKRKSSKAKSGPISGITFELKPGATADVVVNRVKTLAEYVRAEYPNDERMLRIAAFLADVGEA